MLDLLTSVPGIGEVTALTWLSEIVEVQRFANAKAIAAYCGCDPTLKVSAGKVTTYSRRSGNKRLHQALTQAAGLLISRKKEPFGQWGYRIMKSKSTGGYRKAVGAVARRLAVALYHVQRLGVPFSYQKYQFWQTKTVAEMSLADMKLGRFEVVPARLGLDSSTKVANAFYTNPAAEKGVGEKCLEQVKQWLSQNSTESWSGGQSSDGAVRKSAIRLLRKSHTESSPAAK